MEKEESPAGDKKSVEGETAEEAGAMVPTEFADEISLVGPIDRVRDRLQAWRDTPVTTLLLGTRDFDTMRTAAELVL